MIIVEKNYCIYCRGELFDEKEVSNEYINHVEMNSLKRRMISKFLIKPKF